MAGPQDLLVQRVNELYHDALKHDYQSTFEGIEVTEGERWLRCAEHFLKRTEPLKIIEIGTGTGFVPVTVGGLLKIGDHWICSDISSEVLAIAREVIARRSYACQFEFQKTMSGMPYRLPWNDGAADVVLMNSVLHHLEDTPNFLNEISRITRSGGLIIIAHEPNRRFYANRKLGAVYSVFDLIFNLRLKLAALGRRTGTLRLMQRIYALLRPEQKHTIGSRGRRMQEVVASINAQLLRENLIQTPLSEDAIQDLVDIHAATGFDPWHLLPEKFVVEWVETYNHLLTVSSGHGSNPLVQKVDSSLSRRWPNDGAIFFAVYRKPI